MKHAYKTGRFITHAERPELVDPCLPANIARGVHVYIGIRIKDGAIGAEFPWARVDRALDGRIWATVRRTVHGEDHGIESGDEIELRREEIFEAKDEVEARREAEIRRQLLLVPGEIAREIDRHLKLSTTPTSAQMQEWLLALEETAEYFEPLARAQARRAVSEAARR